MSLMRLLAAGSSIRGIKDRRSPYKMTQQHLLPKFGASKGVAEAKAAATSEPVAAPLSSAVTEVGGATLENRSPSGGASDLDCSAPGTIGEAPTEPNPIYMSVIEGTAKSDVGEGGLWRAWSAWRGFSRMRNPFATKSSPTKKGTEPVQGELLLESIKVVRNDLNETDLEVVPAANSQIAAERAAHQPVNDGARQAWRRIAARLFGVRRT